jgi:hypothetical protein
MTDQSYSLVLLGRFPGRDRAVAQALARDFGRDDAWGLQVVGAAPIVLIDGMNLEQARIVHETLAEVEAAGCRFDVQQYVEEGTAKIEWKTPARLRGRSIAELGAAPAVISGGSTATLFVPCPYTGQKIKLTISVQATRMADGSTGIQMQAGAPQAVSLPTQINPSNAPVTQHARPPSRANQIPGTVQAPVHVATSHGVGRAQTSPASNLPIPMPAAQPPRRGSSPSHPTVGSAAQQAHDAPIIGLESLEELVPMEQFPPSPAAQQTHSYPQQVQQPQQHQQPQRPPPQSPVRGNPTARPNVGGVPLPDVPILHHTPAPAPRPTGLPEVAVQSVGVPAEVAPMDLEVFEERVASSGIFKAPVDDGADEAADDGVYCSVYMGKSGNPRVHQLLAEVQGVSVQEAARACQKALVAVAKDVSEADAHDMKARFSAINVNVRITKRK